LDPLTYLGGPIGGAVGKIAGRLGGAGDALASHIGVLSDARRAAMESMVERAGAESANVAGQADRFNAMRSSVDVPGMADASMRDVRRAGQRDYVRASPARP
jgi:hypothetical protein